jgi:hypothetical protein
LRVLLSKPMVENNIPKRYISVSTGPNGDHVMMPDNGRHTDTGGLKFYPIPIVQQLRCYIPKNVVRGSRFLTFGHFHGENNVLNFF